MEGSEPLIILGLIIGSGIASGYEVAFFSLSKQEYEALQKQKHLSTWLVRHFYKNPHQTLATILIANNLFNIAIVLALSFWLGNWLSLHSWLQTILEVIFSTLVLLIFGEILPKIYANLHHKRFLLWFSPIMGILWLLLYPITRVLAWASQRFLSFPPQTRQWTFKELLQAIDLASSEYTPPEEKQLLKAILHLSRIPVKAVMTPRVAIKAIPLSASNEEVFAMIEKEPFARYPVYEGNLDHIQGVLFTKDLLHLRYDNAMRHWQQLIKPIRYVPETQPLHRLLGMFKKHHVNIAIVVDEYGGTVGLITLNDVIEVLTGSAEGGESSIQQIAPGIYLVNAQMPLMDFCAEVAKEKDCFEPFKDEAETLAGVFLILYKRLPKVGASVETPSFRMTVEAMEHHAIKQLRIEFKK